MALDIRTLFVAHALVSLALAALMFVFWRGHRSMPGLAQWTLGSALLGATILGAGLRGVVPDVVSIVIANPLGVLSLAAFWNGIRQFDGRAPHWLAPVFVAVAIGAFVTHHTYVVDDILRRIVVVSATLAGFCALCAVELVRGPARTLRVTALSAASLFGLLALTLLIRALSTALAPPEPQLFAPTLAQGIHFLASMVGNILVVVALLMMAVQRLQQRIAADNVALQAALTTAEARAQDLAQSRRQLAAAQRLEAMGQLTGGVAHDFNNLLTVVAGAVEMMTRGKREWPKVERLSGVALRAVDRGQRLTQSLLTFARRDRVKPEVVDPGRLLGELEPLLRRATGEGTALLLDRAASLPAIRVDPNQLEIAILNLVVNARDALDGKGSIVVGVDTMTLTPAHLARNPDARPGPHVVLSVRDDGRGMPPEIIDKVFEPFFSTKDVGAGSGLGLSQVYGFVRGAAGHITIESAVGTGTTVRLYLPTTDESPDVAEPAASPVVHDQPADGRTLLVVEDDPLLLPAVAESLSAAGYRILPARTAHEALAHLRSDAAIDLMFSDVVMPSGIDGIALAREAKTLRPSLKVLLTSGYPGTAGSSVPSDLDIIEKPYRWQALAAKLQSLLGERVADRP